MQVFDGSTSFSFSESDVLCSLHPHSIGKASKSMQVFHSLNFDSSNAVRIYNYTPLSCWLSPSNTISIATTVDINAR